MYAALEYFMKKFWHDFHHPGLLSLACEAVGGKPNKGVKLGAALVLLRGAIDVHDDIIDESITKDSIPTVYGRFGKDIALLVGDALFIKSLILLEEAIEPLLRKQKMEILNLIKNAFFEVGYAEACEVRYRKNFDLSPEEYFEVLRLKAAAAEISARLGAIIGGGKTEQINALADYGRILGTLMTIRDEFVDIFEPNELKNRAAKECLPLPILYAFKNEKIKDKILQIIQKDELKESDCFKIADLIFESDDVKKLKGNMKNLIREASAKIEFINNLEVKNVLKNLLKLSLKDL